MLQILLNIMILFTIGLVDDTTGTDGLPYTTLSYANGPGGFAVRISYNQTGNRPNLTETDTGMCNILEGQCNSGT